MARLDKLEAESARLRRLEDEINSQLAHVRGKLAGLKVAEEALLSALSEQSPNTKDVG